MLLLMAPQAIVRVYDPIMPNQALSMTNKHSEPPRYNPLDVSESLSPSQIKISLRIQGKVSSMKCLVLYTQVPKEI